MPKSNDKRRVADDKRKTKLRVIRISEPGSMSDAAARRRYAAIQRARLKQDPVTIEYLQERLRLGRKLGLPKTPLDKDQPKYYIKPIERDDILTRAIRIDEEFSERLLELTRDEMFLYFFIAEFICRHHIPPTLAEMIMYIDKFKIYGAPFGDTIHGKFEAQNDLRKVMKVHRVMLSLMKKGWLIWDRKIPGGMILIGRNGFIRELEKEYPIDLGSE